MAPLELSLPEELGADGGLGPADPTRSRETVGVGRTDGSGEPLPVIVRWFDTWATGESDGLGGSV